MIDINQLAHFSDNAFEAKKVSLECYNEIVEFFKVHDHIFAINTGKEKFCK
jgi:hypothetical protein